MFEAKEIKEKLQSKFKNINVTDVMIMNLEKEDSIKTKVYLDNGIGASIKTNAKYLNNPEYVDFIVDSLSDAIRKELDKSKNEVNNMNIKEKLVSSVIKEKAVELQKKLFEEIDNRLNILHEIKIGKKDLFEFDMTEKEVESAYNVLVSLRKTINVPLDIFYELNIEGYIDTIPNWYVDLKRTIQRILYKIE